MMGSKTSNMNLGLMSVVYNYGVPWNIYTIFNFQK